MSSDLVFSGCHVKGLGQAHQYSSQHTPFFGCSMVSTFNITINRPFEHTALVQSRGGKSADGVHHYYMARIQNNLVGAYGWVYRWEGSGMKRSILEVVSRRPLSKDLHQGPLTVTIFPRWNANEIQSWAKDQYWFQTFPWSPSVRKDGHRTADSRLVWNVIHRECGWRNKSVLDIGAHYGFQSLQAARVGATVVGWEPEQPSRDAAVLIDQNIEQEGVEYVARDPGGQFDIILYLSVHHQVDPAYDQLDSTIQSLASRCRDLFVELILPSSISTFGGRRKDGQVDVLVGGRVLKTYRHNVRGMRRIYRVMGTAQ